MILPKDKILHNKRFVDVSSWVNLNQEWAGTREKYILTPTKEPTKYLIKFPEYGLNEVFIELFNCYLAMSLNINTAMYFPCSYKGKEGIITKSFLDNNSQTNELWEMKELICEYANNIELGKKLGRDKDVLQEHDIDNIYMILNEEFGPSVFPRFFEMIGFDCLIGNSDRHWENYGIILSSTKDGPLNFRFAPLYDTATSYLVGWPDEKIVELFNSGGLDDCKWYEPRSKKNTCRITVNGDARTNHFDLLRHIIHSDEYSKYLTSLMRPVRKFDIKIAKSLLKNYCPGLSNFRKEVIIKMLSMRQKIMLDILGKEKNG